MLADTEIHALASQVRSAQDECRLIEPLTGRVAGFDLEAAYRVASHVHAARVQAGAQPRGRKIGFTNANIWPEYGVHHPVWGHVYAHTLVDTGGAARVDLAGLAQPKIEPEIAFGLRSAPSAGADVQALLECIEWVAPAFEIVQSHFPGWKFQAADTVADGGLHGRLVLGARQPLSALGPDPAAVLAGLTLDLRRDGQHVETGRGANVLGSPLAALAHLVALLATQPQDAGLQPGEVVTTGTVTAAYPIAPGQRWESVPQHPALAPLTLHLA